MKKLNILLINDDEDDSYILSEVAQYFDEKIALACVTPDDQTIEQLKRDPSIDIILLDLHIPKISGFDLLRQIRSSKPLKDIPVIIYSARQQTAVVRKCFDLGATLFVEKPYTYKGVERMLRKIMSMEWSVYSSKPKEYSFILSTEDS